MDDNLTRRLLALLVGICLPLFPTILPPRSCAVSATFNLQPLLATTSLPRAAHFLARGTADAFYPLTFCLPTLMPCSHEVVPPSVL